ncbi:hypothetical protein BAE44_0002789 [Dichanthelium oligosanthes]|uniref:Uncharacterized protein n=1 Tax=Dichanthelium oligosanthes TaxID=888268 RepID=A0A1E5WFL0_9POAL|nr:hypothetical protein BAE44_0002789 [Dichanthelium oligosanthes]
MPGGSSYLAAMSMGGRRFAYRKLKKLPPAPATATTLDHQHQHHQQQPPAVAIQESYHSYYRALGAAVARRRQWQQGRRRVRPRLRISGLARALRRKAAAVGGRVRASVAKVARRLKEGRPYIGDLFAGNYMFMQVAPSPTMIAAGGIDDKGGFAPFTEYYYGKQLAKSIRPPAAAAAGALQVHHAAAAGVLLYKV